MLKTLPSVKKMKESNKIQPKKETIDFLLNFSKSIEVKNPSLSLQADSILIHLN